MAGKAPKSIDDLIRARMRRQQFVNSVLVFIVAAAVIAGAGYFIFNKVDWQRPTPAKVQPKEPVPPARHVAPPVAAPAPSATIAARSATAPATAEPIAKPVAAPKPRPVEPEPAPSSRFEAPAPPVTPVPVEPEATATSPLDQPSAAAAKRMLFSIKCFDDLAFERNSHGRHYFSGLCKDGHRKEVSCAGAGCRVEYAPPPSHVP